ncbi:hypothetical protein CERSUDRAFT_94220 [Gelatoporia subvermispora B]|uniref:Uncharacterized protein n=1 Tax=Ceriporiopsis subvermispora (strain B) TaxID=914234 RepID=M2QNQ2_CERS8|nr:hypothetical protein CERSUDRAFT_94220 [Gelatoporia subvermispora B]
MHDRSPRPSNEYDDMDVDWPCDEHAPRLPKLPSTSFAPSSAPSDPPSPTDNEALDTINTAEPHYPETGSNTHRTRQTPHSPPLLNAPGPSSAPREAASPTNGEGDVAPPLEHRTMRLLDPDMRAPGITTAYNQDMDNLPVETLESILQLCVNHRQELLEFRRLIDRPTDVLGSLEDVRTTVTAAVTVFSTVQTELHGLRTEVHHHHDSHDSLLREMSTRLNSLAERVDMLERNQAEPDLPATQPLLPHPPAVTSPPPPPPSPPRPPSPTAKQKKKQKKKRDRSGAHRKHTGGREERAQKRRRTAADPPDRPPRLPQPPPLKLRSLWAR